MPTDGRKKQKHPYYAILQYSKLPWTILGIYQLYRLAMSTFGTTTNQVPAMIFGNQKAVGNYILTTLNN